MMGASRAYTRVADRLEALGLRGHCFVSTDFIGERGFLTAAQIRELDARGHIFGTPFSVTSGAIQHADGRRRCGTSGPTADDGSKTCSAVP